jgi:3-hydroxyacyl-CoA dehydrogenase
VFKAAVVGAGTMGGEIAQVIASADVPVVLKDVKQEFVDAGLAKAREVTQGQLAGLVAKEKIDQQQADRRLEEILGAITGTTEYDGFGDVDFVVEAVPERMEVKQAVFAELDVETPGHAVLASNTSALSISEIGSAGRPARGSSSIRSPTRITSRGRPCSSRRGASWRSCGSTGRPPIRSRRR